MESKIILLHGDKLIKIKSQPFNDISIFEEIEHTNILNDDEKNKYLEFLNNHTNQLISILMNLKNEKIELFINPIHPRMKIYYCNYFNYCKIFNYDEDAILKFANNRLYFDHGKLLKFLPIINTEYYKSKVRTECPICYNKTLCFKFFKCNHVICSDCYFQLDKVNCALCRSN